MQVTVSIDILAPPSRVWDVVTDIKNAQSTIQGIDNIEILQEATGPSITGLRWRETRTMGGKAATEEMWIVEAKEPHHYDTRAESHGAVYKSRFALEPTETGTALSMSFHGEPQTVGAKILWALTGWMAKGYMKKVCAKDLADIKAAAESPN